MNTLLKTHLNRVLIAGALIGCVLLILNPQNSNRTSPIAEHAPQEYMRKLITTRFTEQGNPKDHLEADYWAYLPDQNVSILDQPHLILYKSDNNQWIVSAHYGKAHQPHLGKITQLDLWRDVEIQRPEQMAHDPIVVHTEKMSYFPENERVESDQSIHIEKPGLIIQGQGLNGFLDRNWMEILSDVTTTYQQPHS